MAAASDSLVRSLQEHLRALCAQPDPDAMAAPGDVSGDPDLTTDALMRACAAAAVALLDEGLEPRRLLSACGALTSALVRTAAGDAGGELERLRQRFAKELQRRREIEEFLRIERDLTLALSAAGSMAQAADLVLDAGLRIPGIDSAGLYFVDPETGDHHLAAHRGITPEFAAAVAHVSYDSPTAALTREGRPIYTVPGTPSPAAHAREGLTAVAVLPIVDGRTLQAVLVLSSHTLPEIPPAIRPALEGLAARIGGIVAHVRTEAARRASEARFRTVVTASKDAMIAINPVGRITIANAAAEALFGYELDALLGEPIEQLVPHEFAETHRRIVRDFFSAGASRGVIGRTLELKARRRDGRLVPIELTLSAGQHAEEPFVLAVIRDITARQAAAQALRASEEQFRVLCTVAPVGIFLTDAAVRCLYVNPRLEAITGRTLDDCVARGLLVSVHPADLPTLQAEIDRCLARGEELVSEFRLVRPDGAERWINVTTASLHAENGSVRLRVGIVEDTTARREAERAERSHRDALAHAARITAIGEMASGLAHELAQPLSAILYYARGGGARLARGAWGVDEAARTFAKIAAQAERAAEFIRHVKSFVRKARPVRQPQDLNTLVRETLQLIAPELRSIRLRLHLGEDLPPVDVDRIQIEQVMLNLIRNGIEAMEAVPDTERVLALQTWRETDGQVSFAVQDSGQGVTDEVVQHLFDPFFSTKPGGTGLGLSISRSIIADLHEGTLWVRPGQPHGARCGFTLRPAGAACERA